MLDSLIRVYYLARLGAALEVDECCLTVSMLEQFDLAFRVTWASSIFTPPPKVRRIQYE